jgi:hypothetical protein
VPVAEGHEEAGAPTEETATETIPDTFRTTGQAPSSGEVPETFRVTGPPESAAIPATFAVAEGGKTSDEVPATFRAEKSTGTREVTISIRL